MGIFDKLFGTEEEEIVTSRDLKIALMGVKRERRKKQMEMRRLGHKRNEVIARLKKCRRENNMEEVDFLYEELQQLKIDTAYTKREAKILNLEGIGLQRYLRGIERLERTSNKGRIRELMKRVQTANLDAKLRGQVIDEEAYLEDLNLTLDDIKMELEDVSLTDQQDPDKERFLRDIDEIIAAEEDDNLDVAVEREEKLRQEMDDFEPEEPAF